MHYTAKRQNNLFQLRNERKEILGSLNYAGILPGKAQITTNDNDVYKVAPIAYREAATGITKNGDTYAELQYDKQDSMVVSFQNGKSFFFVKKSKWDNDYAIVDESQKEVASIKPKFKWRSMSFNYEIDVRPRVLDKDAKAAFPFILVYCSHYVRKRRVATVPGKIAASFLW